MLTALLSPELEVRALQATSSAAFRVQRSQQEQPDEHSPGTEGGPAAAAAPGSALTAVDWAGKGTLQLLYRSAASGGYSSLSCSASGQRSAFADTSMPGRKCLATAGTEDVLPTAFSSGCLRFLMADVDGDGRAELLCFGASFPQQLLALSTDPKQRQSDTASPAARAERARALASWSPSPRSAAMPASVSLLRDVCVGDLNGDQQVDFVIASADSALQVWLSAGNGSSRSAYDVRTLRPDWELAASGDSRPALASSIACVDWDNDGWLDVFALYAASASDDAGGRQSRGSAVFLNHGGVLRFAFSLIGMGRAEVAAVADYDGDGRVDLLLAHSSGLLQLFRNGWTQPQQQQPNHWLQLSLYGTRFANRQGTGGTVTVVLGQGSLVLSRSLSDSSGAAGGDQGGVAAQHMHRVHFGLGAYDVVDELQVQLGGAIGKKFLVYHSVAADQHLHILQDWHGKDMSPTLAQHVAGTGFAHTERCSVPGQHRLLPSFFILGQWKCGTTSLAASLNEHPSIRPAIIKELNFFNKEPPEAPFGLSWYAGQFPCGDQHQLSYDATPGYLFPATVPPRLLAAFPAAKLIVLLRDPVERAFSHHKMNTQWKPAVDLQAFHRAVLRQVRDFTHCVQTAQQQQEEEAEQGRERPAGVPELSTVSPAILSLCTEKQGLVTAGLYVVLLRRWLEALGPSRAGQLLVLPSEQFFATPTAVLQLTFRFLNLSALPLEAVTRNVGVQSEMLPETQSLLRDFFRPFNLQLHHSFPFAGHWPEPYWISYAQQ